MDDVCVTFTINAHYGTATFSHLEELGTSMIKESFFEHLLAWETNIITSASYHLISKEIGEDNAAKVDVSIQNTL